MNLFYSGFEWDEKKAATNFRKHGVSFDEAKTVFDDVYARIITDPDHSNEEDRFIILGMSLRANMLVVCHCYRAARQYNIRIISARKATKNEEAAYWRFRHES